MSFFSSSRTGKLGKRSSLGPRQPRKSRRLRALRFEPLEDRELLSVSAPGFAVPFHVASAANRGVAPLSTAGPTGLTPTQIRHAYGFDKISFGGIAGDGSGTTIAIVDAYNDPTFVSSTDPNFVNSDLHKFDLQFGLPDPPSFTKVNQTGGTAYPAVDKGWSTEIALDVEWAHAVAPGAEILLVEAADNSMTNLMTAVAYAAGAPGVVAVSMSWGGGEFSGETTYDRYFTTPPNHGGVTFLASSGDSGAPAGYPAYSPNVVSVGGTTLNVDSQGNILSESGWSGSGGGIAAYESQPAYQKGVVTQSTTRRTSPDVAYDSNPATGFPVYDTENNPVSAPWATWGGTSDAAPPVGGPDRHCRSGTCPGRQGVLGRRDAGPAQVVQTGRHRFPRYHDRQQHRQSAVYGRARLRPGYRARHSLCRSGGLRLGGDDRAGT